MIHIHQLPLLNQLEFVLHPQLFVIGIFSDVPTAFLHADTLGIPYVHPPDTENLQDTTKVWILKKKLYMD